jgi:hypothetical protein
VIESYRRDLNRATRDVKIALGVMWGGIALVALGVLVGKLTGSLLGVALSAPGGATAGIALAIAWLARRNQRDAQERIDNYRHRGFGLHW